MLHIITENNELKNRNFVIPNGVKKFLKNTLDNYNGSKTVDGYKRLNNLLSNDTISFAELKRIKNFFDNYGGTNKSAEFILNGGEPMKTWVNNTLNTARKAVEDFKQAKKEAGINNAYIKPHTKNRQSNKPTKPSQIQFNTNNLNKNISNNIDLKFESKKIVVINSKQYKLLKEAVDDSFSYEELSALPSFEERYKYCEKHLGTDIGSGSSRVVFQIDDEKVLKLAYNEKGVAQNYEENQAYGDDIFPKIFDMDNNGLWLVSEYVLPATEGDFQHCLGISFDDFCEFIQASEYYRFGRGHTILSEEKYGEMCENSEDLDSFDDYIGNYGSHSFSPAADMMGLRNYGLTTRNGQATIVLLDSGLTEEVWNKHYKYT